MTATVGATLQDLQNHRGEDEITIYYCLDQHGPCQNGAWPVVWETFGRRLDLRNVIFGVWPSAENNYLGLANDHNLASNACLFLGDLFEEARNTLQCLACDSEAALSRFEKAFRLFTARFTQDNNSLEPALEEWAGMMTGIPLTADVAETPKVLVIGGLNLLFVHDPVSDYFLGQGVLPKVVPYSEGLCWLAAENMVRYGFEQGLITPEEQFSQSLRGKDKKKVLKARQARYSVVLVNSAEKRFRAILERTGLLFDLHTSFREVAEEGHKLASLMGFTETTVTAGRYLCTVKAGHYDGIVNLGSFNCQPAMNAQAVIRPVANTGEIPYVALDCEGPWISTNQQRLLETLAVQAARVRKRKNTAPPD